jgi:hypothetical protein
LKGDFEREMGSMMFKLTRPLDERGVSIVLGAILLLGIGIAVGSLVYSEYVQSSIHSSEASHMEKVKTNFIQLQTQVASMRSGDTSSVGIPMSADFPFFIPTRGQIGSLSLQGSVYSPGGNIQIGPTGKGYIYGDQATTKSIGGDYLTINEAIFQERFFDASNWIMTIQNDDTSTSSPGLNSGMTHTQDGSNSVYVSVSAQRTESKLENAYWVVKNGINVPGNGNDNVSLSAWLNASINPNIHPDPSAPFSENMSIDYENQNLYQPLPSVQKLYAHQENTTISSGDNYRLLENVPAENTGTNLSVSTSENARLILGRFVYPLTGINMIPTGTWNFYYRTWYSSAPSFQTLFLRPDDNGNEIQWTTVYPAGIQHWQAVADATQDNDNTYIETYTTSQIDVFNLPDTIPTNAVIDNVTVFAVARRSPSQTGSAKIYVGLRTHSIDYWNPSSITVSDIYAPYSYTWENNPYTNLRWTVAEINALQIGVESNASKGVRVTQVYAKVNYHFPAPQPSAHVDVSIRILKSDNTVRQTIADSVAGSSDISSTENTLTGTYNWNNYSIVDHSDFLEIDYYENVTTAATATAYIKIDNNSLATTDQTRVENVTFEYSPILLGSSWNNAILFEDNNPDSFNWIRFVDNSHLTKNQIRNIENHAYIRVGLSDLASAGSSAFAQVGASLSLDEISLLDGPPFDIDVTIKSATINNPDNVENILENIGFWSIGGSAYYTLRIENFASPGNQWENLQSGYVGGTEVFWGNVLNNPRNYIDNISGTIMLRLMGHSDNTPFDLALDWVDLEAVYPSSYIEYYSPNFTKNGRVEFDMPNYSYPDQTYIYEDGAVILYQKSENSSTMVSEPLFPLAVAIPRDNDNIEVDINTILVDKSNISDNSVVKGGWATISVQAVDNYYRVPLSSTPNTAFVKIEIDNSPLTSNAWYNYLNKLATAINLNTQEANAYVQSGEDKFSLIIQGKDNDTLVNDIYYSEKVQEIVVGIA